MLPEMQDYLSDKDRERFVHLYNNLYFQVIEEADVIITTCQTLRVEDWDREKLWSLSQDLPNPHLHIRRRFSAQNSL